MFRRYFRAWEVVEATPRRSAGRTSASTRFDGSVWFSRSSYSRRSAGLLGELRGEAAGAAEGVGGPPD